VSRAALRLVHGFKRNTERESHRLDLFSERCRLLDPVRTIKRGFALLKNKEGKAIKSVNMVQRSDPFFAYLRDGRILAIVEKIKEEETHGEKEKRQLEIW
jgi:exonuclease VII large subunit